MGKRMLITSTDLMMIQFLVPHVQNLAEKGWKVDVACSVVGNRIGEVKRALKGYAAVHTVRLHRSPMNPENLKGYGDMKKVIESGQWDVIWTNEPVMGVATRLAAKKVHKAGTKVIYMVHGFHFYKGAPKLNWMLYYPIERWVSRFTDMIITINKEDYRRAKKFHAETVEYIHGIGVDTARLKKKELQTDIRAELGLNDKDFIVLSVGELNKNKNHKVIIEAVSQLKDKNIKYILCGKGAMRKKLEQLAKKYKIADQIFFLGYRKDVVDICSQSDVFAFPSYREGLGLASLEAMYSGLPLIASRIRGVEDYVENGKSGYLCPPDNSRAFARAIRKLKEDKEFRNRCSEYNRKAVIPYCLENVKEEIIRIMNQ